MGSITSVDIMGLAQRFHGGNQACHVFVGVAGHQADAKPGRLRLDGWGADGGYPDAHFG